MAGFVLVVSLGSPAGQARVVATVMSLFVASLTAWAPVTTHPDGGLAAVRSCGSLRDDSVLMESLSFNLSDSIATRLRVFGGDRSRWIVPVIAAAA